MAKSLLQLDHPLDYFGWDTKFAGLNAAADPKPDSNPAESDAGADPQADSSLAESNAGANAQIDTGLAALNAGKVPFQIDGVLDDFPVLDSLDTDQQIATRNAGFSADRFQLDAHLDCYDDFDWEAFANDINLAGLNANTDQQTGTSNPGSRTDRFELDAHLDCYDDYDLEALANDINLAGLNANTDQQTGTSNPGSRTDRFELDAHLDCYDDYDLEAFLGDINVGGLDADTIPARSNVLDASYFQAAIIARSNATPDPFNNANSRMQNRHRQEPQVDANHGYCRPHTFIQPHSQLLGVS
jgi:hypothetical protein